MCVLLFANPNVREWLEQASATNSQDLLQQVEVRRVGSHRLRSCGLSSADNALRAEVIASHSFHRSAWIQAYFRYTVSHRCCDFSSCDQLNHTLAAASLAREWQKALEAVAKAWRRFLCFAGLR